jgi:carbon-monoxide dehydrogenase small subunit
MTAVSLTVNGRAVTEDVPPRLHLADFLRERLLLTGTHLGCEHGVCGACTIIMDGEPARSCIAYAAACGGMDIHTIEGLEDDAVTIRLRASFTAHHALQCGYCTPGMLVTARDIVRRLPDADDDAIRLELAGNLCRCTGYNNIVRAIRQVLDEKIVNQLPTASVIPGLVPGTHAPPPEPGSPAASANPEFTGPVSGMAKSLQFATAPAALWSALRDPALIAGCIPGVRLLAQEGGHVTGEMTVSLGPVKARFRGEASIAYDDAARRGRIEGGGRDQLSGTRLTAAAPFRVAAHGAGSVLAIEIGFSLQGPLAQLAKGRVVELVADEIAGVFARNLAAKLAGEAVTPQASLAGFGFVWRLLLGWLKGGRG